MRRPARLAALCAALVLLLARAVSAAQLGPGAEPGPAEGIAMVAGKQVPLPPGQWLTLATTRDGAAAEAVETRILARIEDKAVTGLVLARATAAPLRSIMGTSAECDRTDIYLAYTAYDTAYDGLCAFLNLVQLSPRVAGPPAWQDATAALAARGLHPDATWLMVGIRARTRSEALEVRYYFLPPGSAGPAMTYWMDSPWSPARIGEDPARGAAVAQLALWSAWTREAVEAGLRGRLDPAARLPWPWAGDLAARLVARRLQALDALAAAGAIDAGSYREQRRQLEAVVVAPQPSETPVLLHAMWKTTSYGVLAFLDAVGVTYLVLGDVVQSGVLVALNLVVRPVATYLHELAWTYSGYGRAAPAARYRDFAEIGLDR